MGKTISTITIIAPRLNQRWEVALPSRVDGNRTDYQTLSGERISLVTDGLKPLDWECILYMGDSVITQREEAA
jgi:hypothetical protein